MLYKKIISNTDNKKYDFDEIVKKLRAAYPDFIFDINYCLDQGIYWQNISYEELKAVIFGLTKIAQTAEGDGDEFYYNVIPAVKELLVMDEGKYFDGFMEMAQEAEDWSEFLLFGIPTVKELINTPEKCDKNFEKVKNGFVEMAYAAWHDAKYLFKYGIPAVKELINTPEKWDKNFEKVKNGFKEMVKAADNDTKYFFKHGISAEKEILVMNEGKYFNGFVEMAQAAGGNVRYLFKHYIPVVKELINTPEKCDKNFEKVKNGFVKMAQAAGDNASDLFNDGIPAVKELLVMDEGKYFDGFVEIVERYGEESPKVFKQIMAIYDQGLITEENVGEILQSYILGPQTIE